MYKVYINEVPVFLCMPNESALLGYRQDDNHFVMPYLGKRKQIKQYVDMLAHRRGVVAVVLHHTDLDLLWQDFKSCFEWVEAAGGYVLNATGQLLVFYRRGYWDMPKGKIDPGETPEQAAVREVQEETGLLNVKLGDFLTHTYHTYEHKGKRVLKNTWWYRMSTSDTQVVPQSEEDIEKIEWVNPGSWLEADFPVYDSIKDVMLSAS
jgi:8-oxo-dGTP pyrophosphatase MutT (NUDIX family)